MVFEKSFTVHQKLDDFVLLFVDLTYAHLGFVFSQAHGRRFDYLNVLVEVEIRRDSSQGYVVLLREFCFNFVL